MYMHMLIFVVYHCLGIYCYTSTRAHYCVILLYNPLSENISSVSMYALSGSKATPFNSVFTSFPYSLAFVSYSVGGKEEIEEKEQCRKCVIDVFSTCWCIYSCKNRYHCLLYSCHFSSTVLFTQFLLIEH